MREGTFPGTEAVRRALIRHQRRREQGVPTLSVLIGPGDDAVAAWRDWAGAAGWPAAEVAAWPGDDAAAPGNPPPGAVLYVGGTSTENDEQRSRKLARAVAHLSQLLTAAGPEEAGAARAISVRREDAAAFLRDNAYSRAGAMFIEGMVELSRQTDPPAEPAPPEEIPPAGAGVSYLARLGVRPATTERFAATAAACRRTADAPPAGDENDDRARSAAERFLFELLGDLPDTAGLFELNVRLGFCFGPMRAEVDLCSPTLGLAVEIDGFHHFRDPENYRRDRRKDALLQKQGYLVLRFLAEDVVVRLEDILEEIRAAVAFRRATR